MSNSKDLIKIFKSLPEDEASTLHEAILCKYCLQLDGKKVSRNDPSHKVWENGEFTRIICQAEKEYFISDYFDNVLRNLPRSNLKETPLTQLFDDKKIKSVFLVGNYEIFCHHFRLFVTKLVWDLKYRQFSYKFLTVAGLRDIKFAKIGENRSYGSLDDQKLLILDLNQVSYNQKSDSDHILELIHHRERTFQAVWFINSTEVITNKNVESKEVTDKIMSFPQLKIGGKGKGKETAIVEVQKNEHQTEAKSTNDAALAAFNAPLKKNKR